MTNAHINHPTSPVVISYDGSPAGSDAIRRAAELFPGARAIVTTVWLSAARAAGAGAAALPGPVVAAGVAGLDAEAEQRAWSTAREGLAVAREHGLAAMPLAVRAERGIAAALATVAQEHGAHALVAAPHRSRLERMIAGSITASLLRCAPCPVVVVAPRRLQVSPPSPASVPAVSPPAAARQALA